MKIRGFQEAQYRQIYRSYHIHTYNIHRKGGTCGKRGYYSPDGNQNTVRRRTDFGHRQNADQGERTKYKFFDDHKLRTYIYRLEKAENLLHKGRTGAPTFQMFLPIGGTPVRNRP